MKNLVNSKLVLLAVLVLVVAACGGGDSSGDGSDATEAPTETEAPAGTDAPTATEAPADAEAPDDDADEEDSSAPSVEGVGAATVTLDGETYYFGDAGHPALQCLPNFFGVMIAFLQRVDESGNAIDGGGGLLLTLLHEGTDPIEVDQLNEMTVQLDELDQEWIADETHPDERDVEPGMSQVDSVTFNGNTATGTATLYEEESYWAAGGDPNAVATATATFEATCFED